MADNTQSSRVTEDIECDNLAYVDDLVIDEDVFGEEYNFEEAGFYSHSEEEEDEDFNDDEHIDTAHDEVDDATFFQFAKDVGWDTQVEIDGDGAYAYSDDKSFDDDVAYDLNNPKIKEGVLFKDVSEYREALRQYSVSYAYELKFIKNDPLRVTVTCVAQGCTWRCHASRLKDGHTFKIKKVTGEHNCPGSYVSRSANAKFIANWMQKKLKNNMHMSAANLMREFYTEYGVNVKYKKVWRAYQIALERLRGSYENSFRLVPRFCKVILQLNPGSTACYKTEEDGAFQRMFLSFSANKKGFFTGCRPFLGLDGCHLKGKYKGNLLAATTLDGNNGLFPFAIGVVEAENRDSWMWFLDKMSLTLGLDNNILFLSDRQKGLVEAVSDIFPHASHHFCVRHMYANFKKQHPGFILKEAFWQAAQAYTMKEFEEAMTLLRSRSVEAHAWLSKIPPTTWSRSHFDTQFKVDILTNNLSESFNAWISNVRDMPIVEMMDTIRQKLMVSMRKRHEDSSKMNERLVPKVSKRLEMISRTIRGMSLLRSGEYEWEVTEVGFNLVSTRSRVLLDQRSCSCRRWDLSGIPCKHVVACILNIRGNIDDYCHAYYHIDALRATYSEAIHSLPDARFWPQVILNPVYPPHCRRPPGRPKKNRRKDVDEPLGSSQIRSVRRCHRCGNTGHNKATCKAPLQGGPSGGDGTSQGDRGGRGSRSRGRGISQGHNTQGNRGSTSQMEG